MMELLTALDMQDLLQVDRSTIYRMADDGRLPAIKVGRQWCFPAEDINNWLQTSKNEQRELANLLSLDWLHTIQITFSDLLGAMVVVTDVQGKPIIQPTHPCGLFTAVNQQPDAMEKFIKSWGQLVNTIDLTPSFRRSHLGLLCARSMIAVGAELKGMVVVGCVAPASWPPSTTEIDNIAARFSILKDDLLPHISSVYFLDDTQKSKVLSTLPRIAAIIASMVNENQTIIDQNTNQCTCNQ